jgi:hypothetical protein
LTAHGVAERLIDWSKADRITLVCTSLLDEISGETEGYTPLHISNSADTWIHRCPVRARSMQDPRRYPACVLRAPESQTILPAPAVYQRESVRGNRVLHPRYLDREIL